MAIQQTVTANAERGPAIAADNSIRARDRLLQKISTATDLPALGSSVSQVVQMTSSDHEAVRDLARFILSDVALAQKILRIANAASFRTVSGTPVTTISKAIFLLGFENVKTCALAMLLVDGMSSQQAQNVRIELAHALCASIVGRETARRGQFKDSEEAAIAALFKNIGRVLVAAHEHEAFAEISRLVDGGKHTAAQASLQVLGCSFDSIGDAVLRGWNIPQSIVQALVPPPAGVLKPAKTRQEWMQQVAAFSAAAARLIPATTGPAQDAAVKAVLTRFGGALGFDQSRLSQLFASAAQEARMVARNAQLAVPLVDEEDAHIGESSDEHLAPAQDIALMHETGEGANPLDEFLLESIEHGQHMQLQITQRHASGKPMNARDLLLAGVQDVSQMMSSGRCKVNDLILLVLETLYSSLGFRFATICLKDVQSGQYRARLALGEKNDERQAGFIFQAKSSRDLFHLAMENDADLMISDASAPKIHKLLPAWHRMLLPDARSFIVLPLVVQKKQLGLFYADRIEAAPEGVPSDETALIKTLKGQVLTALNTR